MLYKYINSNTIQRQQNPIYINNSVISNPNNETLYSLGYRNLVLTDEIIPNGIIEYVINEKGDITQEVKSEEVYNEII